MPRLHLTDVVVQRLKTVGIYYDETTPAFGVRVGKNRKAWIITKGSDRQRISIGRYPAMSLAEARKEAKKRLAEEHTPRTGLTYSEAYDEYKLTLAGKKPRTEAEYKRLIEKHFIPKLGKKRLSELSYDGIVDCVKGVAPSEATHALVVCRAFLRWCVRPPRRYIPHSPLEGMEVKASKKRKRVLKPSEMKTVWEAAAKQSYPYGTIVQLLLLTGQRRGEIANLRRTWINEKERTITLPDWVTKNKKEHTFPYNGMVSEILETVPRLNSSDLLFPSRNADDRPLSGWSKYKRDLADGVPGWTLHDLRRTYRSTHGEIGTPREIAERLINHVAGVTTEVEEIYDRWTYLPQMRNAVEAYEAHLTKILARA
jgi:integrase